MGLVTSGGFNVLGNDGRCSLIGREAGFANVGADAQPGTSTHGNEASFEFLVDKDPDYLFVLDGMPPLAPTGPSWPRKWWRTS